MDISLPISPFDVYRETNYDNTWKITLYELSNDHTFSTLSYQLKKIKCINETEKLIRQKWNKIKNTDSVKQYILVSKSSVYEFEYDLFSNGYRDTIVEDTGKTYRYLISLNDDDNDKLLSPAFTDDDEDDCDSVDSTLFESYCSVPKLPPSKICFEIEKK